MTMRPRLPSALLFLLLCLSAMPAAARDRCALSATLNFVDAPLPNLAKRLREGGDIRIMVLGSASSLQHESGSKVHTYIVGLPGNLETQFPGRQFTIDNRSQRSLSAQDMLRRIKQDVLTEKPDLLIWQTGNVEAARQTSISSFTTMLKDGLRKLREAGIDVVLVGPQYRARLAPIVDAQAFNQTMGWIGDAEGVPVFPRYEIMQFWAENEVFDLQNPDQARQMQEAGQLNRCLAWHLSATIKRAASLPPR